MISPDEMSLLRGDALDAYTKMEVSMCNLFANLLGTSPGKAGVVFYRINNARSRIWMIETLLKMSDAWDFKSFWASLVTVMKPIDQMRNEIAHWLVTEHFEMPEDGKLDLSDGQKGDAKLSPPNFWVASENTPKYGQAEMSAFVEKCQFLTRGIALLNNAIFASGPEDRLSAWRDICRQSVDYPPPDTHPLSQNRATPENPPRSSQA